MATFKQFASRQSSTSSGTVSVIKPQSLEVEIRKSIATPEMRTIDIFGRPKKDPTKEFCDSLSSLIQSEEFIDQLSREIGGPGRSESEDEFASRAKTVMKRILLDKLSK